MAEADWHSRLALKFGPDEGAAWWARAEVLERAGTVEEALSHMQEADQRDPQYAEFWAHKGELLDRAGQHTSATTEYTRFFAKVIGRRISSRAHYPTPKP